MLWLTAHSAIRAQPAFSHSAGAGAPAGPPTAEFSCV